MWGMHPYTGSLLQEGSSGTACRKSVACRYFPIVHVAGIKQGAGSNPVADGQHALSEHAQPLYAWHLFCT
jgi:hypothetical protein